MNSGEPRRSRFGLITLAFPIAALAGCGQTDGYPQNLVYSVRTDFIVKEQLKQAPVEFNHPGHQPLDFLAELPHKYDPDKKARVIDFELVNYEVEHGKRLLTDNQKAVLSDAANNILDPRTLTGEERATIDKALTAVFGTPSQPTVRVKKSESDPLGVEKAIVDKLKLDETTLADGAVLYRRQCLHCHGLEGNGRGPTGPWVNPHPRDYRQGRFKFTSTDQPAGARKPRRDDLFLVLKSGIDGSSMPSFGLLSDDDLNKLVSYVMHLSMRGEIEFYVIKQWMTEGKKLYDPPTPQDIEVTRRAMILMGAPAAKIAEAVKKLGEIRPPAAEERKTALEALEALFPEPVGVFAGVWAEAQDKPITPDAYPYLDTKEALLESAKRGHDVYISQGDAGCVSCHKNYGRESTYAYDDWGTIVRARNLVDGFYRGGKRPIDVYYRIHSGINGANMTGFADQLKPSDEDKAKKIDKIWDLVNLMQVLRYADLRNEFTKKYGIKVD